MKICDICERIRKEPGGFPQWTQQITVSYTPDMQSSELTHSMQFDACGDCNKKLSHQFRFLIADTIRKAQDEWQHPTDGKKDTASPTD